MPEATLVNNAESLQATAGAAYDCGDVVQLAGFAGIVEGLSGVASGDKMNVRIRGVFDIACASGTTLAAGVRCEWDDTAKLVVAAAGGDFELGTVVKAKVSGELVARVAINETPLT